MGPESLGQGDVVDGKFRAGLPINGVASGCTACFRAGFIPARRTRLDSTALGLPTVTRVGQAGGASSTAFLALLIDYHS